MGKSQKAKNALRRIGNFFVKLFDRFTDALFPPEIACVDCGNELKKDSERWYSLCEKCAEKLSYRDYPVCEKCASPLDENGVCKNCEKNDFRFNYAFAPFSYEGTAKKMILDYKIGLKTYLYKYFARHLSDYMRGMKITADAICYVPPAQKALRKRGFDHMKKVALALSEETQIPFCAALTRSNKPKITEQKKTDKGERFANVRGAFKASTDSYEIAGKIVLLVDDVLTTGATASECARVLKEECGAEEVTVLTLARR